MKNNITQISIIIGLLFSTLASAAQIDKIEISGLDVIPNSTVLSYLPVQTGDEITTETTDQIIKTLYSTGFFEDVSTSIEDATVYVSLVENAHIKYFDVLKYSDKVLSSDMVSNTISTFSLDAGEIFNKKSLFETITALKLIYIT